MIKKTLFPSFVLMAMTAAAQKTTITIDVNKPLHAVSPTLFGIPKIRNYHPIHD